VVVQGVISWSTFWHGHLFRFLYITIILIQRRSFSSLPVRPCLHRSMFLLRRSGSYRRVRAWNGWITLDGYFLWSGLSNNLKDSS
jgi:hypothetical protein